MRQLYLLIKTRLANSYSFSKIFDIKKSKLLLYALAAIYVIATLFIASFQYANSAASYFAKYQMMPMMLVLFFGGASLATFMFTIYNAKSSMFNADDNDLLLSMPIKSSVILASRLICLTIWNLLTSLFVMLPAFIIYAMKVDVPFIYYIYSFIVFLLLPIIPTILASIVGYIIAYFTSKSNIKNWFEIIMSFAFFVAIYYGMSKIDVILNFMVNNITDLENILKWCFYPIYLVMEIFDDYNVFSLMIYIFINVGVFVLFTYLLSIYFKRIIAKLQENRTKADYVLKDLKTRSIIAVLYIKELKRYLSSPIYVFNTSAGSILIIVAAIASIFYDKEQILTVLGVASDHDIYSLLAVAVIFVAFLSCTTSASISIEGKNYWLLKTLPINPIKIFDGKMLLNISLILPFVYIALIIFKIVFNLELYQLLILFILSTISALVSSKLGLLVNLKFPKMDAINDVAIVKRSISVVISIFLPMAVIFGGVGLYSLIENVVNFNAYIIIITLLLFGINIAFCLLLKTWGIKRFKEIN